MFSRIRQPLLAMALVGAMVSAGLLGGEAGAKKVKLYHLTYVSQIADFARSTIIPDYVKEHPDVQIEIVSYPLRELEKKLATAVPTRAPGLDIFLIGTGHTAMRYYNAGLLADPPAYVVDFVKKSMPPWVPDQFVGGEILTVPFFQNVMALYWNKTYFAEAGISEAPATWDELIEDAQKLVKHNPDGSVARSGISLRLLGGSGLGQKFNMFLQTAGGSIIKEAPSGRWHSNLNNQGGWDTLKLYIDLLYKYKVDDYVVKHDAEAFALGQTAMFERGNWVVGYIKEHAPELGYGTAPLLYRTVKTYMAGITAHWVTKACKDQKEAWDWILFMRQPKYLKFMFEEFGRVPVRTVDVDYSDIYAKVPQFKIFTSYPAGYVPWIEPRIPENAEIQTKAGHALEAAFKDKSLLDNMPGMKKVMANVEKMSNELLKEAGIFGME